MVFNQELMTRWIEALESGRYHQGRGMLRQKDSNGNTLFCCLGVLQHIAPSIKDSVEVNLLLDRDSVEEVLGCRLDQGRLSRMNDGTDEDENPLQGPIEPMSFAQIAARLRIRYGILT